MFPQLSNQVRHLLLSHIDCAALCHPRLQHHHLLLGSTATEPKEADQYQQRRKESKTASLEGISQFGNCTWLELDFRSSTPREHEHRLPVDLHDRRQLPRFLYLHLPSLDSQVSKKFRRIQTVQQRRLGCSDQLDVAAGNRQSTTIDTLDILGTHILRSAPRLKYFGVFLTIQYRRKRKQARHPQHTLRRQEIVRSILKELFAQRRLACWRCSFVICGSSPPCAAETPR